MSDTPATPFTLLDEKTFKVPLSSSSQASIVDLDGDGQAELLLLNALPDFSTSTGSTGSSGSDGEEGEVSYGSLFVFTQKKKGDFEWAHPTRIDLPQASRKVGSFCVLGGRGGAPARVVASTEKQIFLVTPAAGAYRVEPMDGGNLGSVEAVSCADFDGDGIDDLAVAVDGSLQVFRGASRLP